MNKITFSADKIDFTFDPEYTHKLDYEGLGI